MHNRFLAESTIIILYRKKKVIKDIGVKLGVMLIKWLLSAQYSLLWVKEMTIKYIYIFISSFE